MSHLNKFVIYFFLFLKLTRSFYAPYENMSEKKYIKHLCRTFFYILMLSCTNLWQINDTGSKNQKKKGLFTRLAHTTICGAHKRPHAWAERAVAAATSWMFKSQLMKLISGSTSRVCLMRSCVSCVEGIVVLGGGILITLLSALK